LNITVFPVPVPIVFGDATVCQGSNSVYTTQAGYSNYQWQVSAGGNITSGAGTNTIHVHWNGTGSQSVSVMYTNSFGCPPAMPTVLNVTVNPTTAPVITGDNSVCLGTTGVIYTTQPGFNNYQWTVSSGGVITSGAGTNTIMVDWNAVGAQSVSNTFANSFGCQPATPTILGVTVNPIPEQPVITKHNDTLYSSLIVGNQWYRDGNLLAGATGQYYVVDSNGFYTVINTIGECSSILSAPFAYIWISVNELEVSQSFEVYPNPNTGNFNIKITTSKPVEYDIEIYNSLGALEWKEAKVAVDRSYTKHIDLQGLATGVYLVVVRNAEGKMVKKMIVKN
jgi:hypothetical protein